MRLMFSIKHFFIYFFGWGAFDLEPVNSIMGPDEIEKGVPLGLYFQNTCFKGTILHLYAQLDHNL